jgi:CDP-glycerol glycerophosphotransferase
LGKLLFSADWNKDDKVLRSLFRREAQRTFGSAEFDTIVHFTGYDRHVATMICGMHAPKVVYMHNDMWKEIRTKGLADPRPLRMAIDAADTVAVVRRGVEHDYCMYATDVSRKVALAPNALPTQCVRLSLLPIDVIFAQDMSSQDKDRVIHGLEQSGKVRFVNIGRFSAEKGQERLIRAFEQVWLKRQESQLYIVGSYGPLFDEVCLMAKRSIAATGIFVVKGSTNPFPLLTRMNTFVLSSHYEGLPIVLFESLALGVPIVATDIPGVTEFLSQGYGVTVENSQTGLTSGMLDSICREKTVAEYDIDAHNRDAVQKFHSMIDSTHRPLSCDA